MKKGGTHWLTILPFSVIDGMVGQLLATVDRIGRIGSRRCLRGSSGLVGVSVLAIPHLLCCGLPLQAAARRKRRNGRVKRSMVRMGEGE